MLRRLFIVFILISTFAVAGCKISGTITLDGEGLGGVTVYLDGEGEDGNASIMAITLPDGTYVFEGFHHGTLTITPEERADYTFSPDSQTVTVDFFENVLDVDFTAIVEKQEPDSPEPPEPWSTYQGDAAHTGYVPLTLNTDTPAEDRIWTRELSKSDPLNPVAAGDGEVFVTTGANNPPHVAMALDSATGETLWAHYDFDDSYSVHPPAYANGTVYVQSGVDEGSFLWAFDAVKSNLEDGAVFIKTPYVNTFARYYAPTVYIYNDDVGDKKVGVYTGGDGSTNGGVYGFDGLTGDELWHLDLTPYEQWTPAVNDKYVIAYTGWYTDADLVRTESQLTVIHRLDGPDGLAGEVAFTIPDPKFEWFGFIMDLAPILGSVNNVIAINGGRLISFDLEAEDIGWETPGEEDSVVEGFSGQPSLANGIIYAVYDGYLRALDEGDGLFIDEWLPWQPPSGESIVTPMIVTDNLILVSTASETYAVDLESQTDVWSYPAGGHLALSEDGVLFIATSKGILHAISTLE